MNTIVKLLITFALCSQAFAALDDVAIHPETGDTVIAERVNNPSAKIIFLNDFDESFKQEITILPIQANDTKVEIELNKTEQVTYLVQTGGLWMIGTINKIAGNWEKSPLQFNLTGKGVANNLTSLPDGNIALSIKEENSEEKVFIIGEENDEMKVLDQLKYEEVKARAESIAKLENTLVTAKESSANTSSAKCEDGDEDCDEDLEQSGYGFAAGAITGLGISYRRHMANKLGYQITGIAWGSGDFLFLSVGANFMKTLHATKRTRFMAIAGLSTYYNGSQERDWSQCDYESNLDDPCANIDEYWQNSVTINIGVGLGMEFMLSENIGLALELPIVLMVGSNNFGVYPIPSASLIYYF